jgi:hypothetical protein
MVFESTSIEHENFSLHEIIDSIITKNTGKVLAKAKCDPNNRKLGNHCQKGL